MSITTENPTGEEILAALKSHVPSSEFERLRTLVVPYVPYWEDPAYSGEWNEEDLRDAKRSTAFLIEKRFGSVAVDYD